MNVYDFDNTIYDGESAFHLFRFFMKKDKGLITFLPAVVTAFTKYKLGKLTVEEAINKYAQRALDYYIENPHYKNCMEEQKGILWKSQKRRWFNSFMLTRNLFKWNLQEIRCKKLSWHFY